MSVSKGPTKILNIGLYAHGLHLDPEVITKLLGRTPTRSWKAGHHTSVSTGRVVTKKLGLWCITREFDDVDLNDALEQFLSSLDDAAKQLKMTDGVDSVFLDLHHSEAGINCYPEIVISHDNLAKIAALELPLHITVFADSQFDATAAERAI
jgi:hypothetical protein